MTEPRRADIETVRKFIRRETQKLVNEHNAEQDELVREFLAGRLIWFREVAEAFDRLHAEGQS